MTPGVLAAVAEVSGDVVAGIFTVAVALISGLLVLAGVIYNANAQRAVERVEPEDHRFQADEVLRLASELDHMRQERNYWRGVAMRFLPAAFHDDGTLIE